MGQDRLSALALLSIEAQLLQEINYDDIIDDFCADQSQVKEIFNLINVKKKYIYLFISHFYKLCTFIKKYIFQ